MAQQPKPPQHEPPRPSQPAQQPAQQPHQQPQPSQQPGQQPRPGQPQQQPPGQPRGEGVPPPAEPVKDQRGELPPGTPWTPPEGHDHAEPAPGQPGGATSPPPKEAAEPPPVHTIADEQRMRSAEVQAQGVEPWKQAHDERTEEERRPRQVPGVAQPKPSPAAEGERASP